MLSEDIIIKIVDRELAKPSLATVEQFLEIHNVKRTNGVPVVNRIDTESADEEILIYLAIENMPFYLTLVIDASTGTVRASFVEAFSRVYLSATSETISWEEMCRWSSIKPTSCKAKHSSSRGDKMFPPFNSIVVEPNPEADSIEDKLEKLLDVLETDPNGVKKWVECANAQICVAVTFHHGNHMLGGMHFPHSLLKRLTSLDLDIDFDLYTAGNSFQ